jgi:hypothetical protein
MPAKDRYHDAVKRALAKDGWVIADEQVQLFIDNRILYIDMEIAHPAKDSTLLIEVKELYSVPSPVDALAAAVGKYVMYRAGLRNTGVSNPLYMAVSVQAYENILSEKVGRLMVAEAQLLILVFDPDQEVVVQWIP